ncbi:MAG: hypothetical protein IKQ10_02795 [Oscillospiraceae bacterium]|nr:hypothetical protein [Oscillospiraceae bacterium]
MDSPETKGRSGAASRPPRSDEVVDAPLFTDVPYTPVRRTANNGRPAPARTEPPASARRSTNTSLYGGRDYASARRSAPSTSVPPQQNRTVPTYTELSWDELFRSRNAPPQQNAPAPQPRAQDMPRESFSASPAPQPRSGSRYFGGFDQEMEELFYHRDAARTDNGSREYGDGPAANDPGGAAYGVRPQNTAPAAPTRTVRPGRSAGVQPMRQAPRVRNTGRPAEPAPAPRYASPRQPARPAAAQRRSSVVTPPPRNGHRAQNTGFRLTRPMAVGGASVLALLLLLLVFVVSRSNGPDKRPVNVAVSTPIPATTAFPASAPEETPEVTATPTPAPTPTPSGPKAKRSGNLIVSADWGPTIPERARVVYDSFFDKSCMIGNSLVEGFFMWAGMNNMRFIYGTGATVNNAVGGLDLAPLTLNPAGYYNNIYLMFGLNEVGTDVNSFVQGYKKLVDFIRQYQPDANIIIISVTPVTKRVDEDPNEVQSMDRIRNFNAALREFCVDQDCWYLDIYNLLLDSDGYLSADYAFAEDGKHFEKSGYVAWANYMKSHYVDDGLLTE